MASSVPSRIGAYLMSGPQSGVAMVVDLPTMSSVTTADNKIASIFSLAAREDRAFAVFPAPGTLETWMVSEWGDFVVQELSASTDYPSVDVSWLREHVFVAGGASEHLEVLRFDDALNASYEPKLMMARNLSASEGIAGLDGYDGASVSMASARERVMVTWLNGGRVGYALLRCDV